MNVMLGRNAGFAVLWSGQFLATAGLTVMVPLLPFYLTHLGVKDPAANRFWTGLCVAAPAVTLCLVSPVWGRIGDRWGRKWMVVRALFGLAGCLLLMSFCQTPFQFFLCRLLQGAFGGVVDAASAYASSEAPKEERGKVLGMLQSATAAGSLIGPLIGGVLADWIGFRALLWAIGVLTGISGAVAVVVLRETYKPKAEETPKTRVYGTWITLMGHARLRSFLIAGLCAQIGVFGLVVVFAPYVQGLGGTDGQASTWVGILQAVTWGASMLGAPWWGVQNDRRKVEINLFWAVLGCAVSILLQVVPSHVYWLIPLRLLQGFCFSAVMQSVMLAVTEESTKENRGLWIGAANSFLVLGQLLGPLTVAVLGGLLSNGWLIVIMGMTFLVGAVALNRSESWKSVVLPSIQVGFERWKMKDDQ
ncbi:staphyloferrin B export MFS transporter [Polycladomyces abyssicola]|uniref:Staphyloferrin B export MFS transporter n=1 Tax=Polycladomyces abyssicola TaxID=1125966 RepID=A0A8D5ZJP4_9BACL|nr:MFS transporter [Polycladomyces abyssicola]BCU80729.1 staphyloferrin B export MFS transporter [Polycladomyces abyssicola]